MKNIKLSIIFYSVICAFSLHSNYVYASDENNLTSGRTDQNDIEEISNMNPNIPIRNTLSITFKTGNNINIKHDYTNVFDFGNDHNITIETKDDLEANSIKLKNNMTVLGYDGDNIVINQNGINAGSKKITKLHDGVDDKDAVNVSQLNNMKNELNNAIINNKNSINNISHQLNNLSNGNNTSSIWISDNDSNQIDLSTTSQTTPFKFRSGSNNLTVNMKNKEMVFDLSRNIEVNSLNTKEINTEHVSINQNGIHAGGTVIKNVGNGRIEENSKDAVNGGQIYDLLKKHNTPSNPISLSSGKNIMVKTDNVTGTKIISTTDNISVNTLSVSEKIHINEHGYNGGGEKITNIADGEISKTSSDAITGKQLHQALQDVQNTVTSQSHITNQSIMNIQTQVNNSIRQIDNLRSEFGSAIAASNAMAGLSQVNQYGSTMISASIGGYHNKQAFAIGVSGMSDNGKWIYRVNGAVGLNKGENNQRLSYSGSVGYQF